MIIAADMRLSIPIAVHWKYSWNSFGHGMDASSDPKHIACGAPDFIVEKGKVPLGYVETKDVGADLDKVEKSDQMKRYLKALHNLILTDYVEFRWYVNGGKKTQSPNCRDWKK